MTKYTYEKSTARQRRNFWDQFNVIALAGVEQLAESICDRDRLTVTGEVVGNTGSPYPARSRVHGMARSALHNVTEAAGERLDLGPELGEPVEDEQAVRVAATSCREALAQVVIAAAVNTPGMTNEALGSYWALDADRRVVRRYDGGDPYSRAAVREAVAAAVEPTLAYFQTLARHAAASGPEYGRLLNGPIEVRERPA